MSRFFPHTQYAEDQPLFHTILITHCLHRGFTIGGTVGAGVGACRALFLSKKPSPSPSPYAHPHPRPLLHATIRGAGTGAVVGTGLLAVGVTARMWGRDEIEWRDRSWRLCENEGQKNTDDGSLIGIGIGILGAALMAGGGRGAGSGAAVSSSSFAGWRGALGGAALGSLVGGGVYSGIMAAMGSTTEEKDSSSK